jgi:Uncharacterized protein conserved in bacteria
MKKFFYVLVISLFVFTLAGCSSDEKEKTMKCSLKKSEPVNGVSVYTDYTVTYVGDIIKKAELVETLESDNKGTIEYYYNYFDAYYDQLNDKYGGYTWKLSKTDNKVVSNTTMDYTKINLKKYAEDVPIFKNYLNDNNELTIKGLKSLYATAGITCED